MDENYVYWRDLRTGEVNTLADTILEKTAKEKGRQLNSKERREILKTLTPDAQYAIIMNMYHENGTPITSKDAAYQDFCQHLQNRGVVPPSRLDFESTISQNPNVKQELTIGTREYWVGLKLRSE